MKTHFAVPALTMTVALAAVAPAARAFTVTGVGAQESGGPVTLLNTAGFTNGQVFSEAINIPTAGTLTINLAGVSWLDVLQNLNCFLSAPGGGIIGNANNGTSDSVQVQPGTDYVNWYGQTNGPLFLGAYSISAELQPSAPPPPPVPLPAALPLLLSGLGALTLGLRRSRQSPTPGY